MKQSLWLILLIPFTVTGQFKFKSGTSLLTSGDHFSGSVIGIADMNNDGLDDIVTLQYSRKLSIEYQSAPGKPFVHRLIGDLGAYEFWNISIADINQDGLNDMVFTANENVGYVYYSQRVGDSTAYLVQGLSGSNLAYAQGANLVDINNDGWLDFFLCSDLGVNRIWANDTHGLITGNPVSWIDFNVVPTSDNSGNYGSVWSDLDNDGDLDLYVAKCKAGVTDPADPRRINTFFKNNNGTYVESAAAAGIAFGDQSWTAVAGDSDNDGDMDLFVINHFSPSKLLINDGHGIFNEAIESGIGYSSFGVQAAWVDLDNDGLLDLVISGSAHTFYRNKGQNKFELISLPELGLLQIESFSIGDLNQDGKVDLYASYSKVINEASGRPDALWLNDVNNGNHFINVRLTGVKSNRSAVGAKITLVTGNSRQTREIYAGQSYGVSASLTQHFGIGSLSKIDTLVVRWPDGTTERIEAPFIDRTISIKQNTCFGFDPLITLLPNKNILCNPTDSVVMTAPITGDYRWTDGRTTRSIVVKSPGNYQVKVKAPSGCELFSNIQSIGKNEKINYPVTVSDSVVCDGSIVTLNLPVNKFIQWNTGDSGQLIQVKTSGKYYAIIQSECGIAMSDTIQVRVVQVPPLTGKNDTVRLSGKANLSALGNSVFWFETAVGGNPIATGNNFLTPPLSKSTTYYAQSIITNPGKIINAGIKDFNSPSKFHATTFSGKLFFDATQKFRLKSVKVYADTPGVREIDLLNVSGAIIASNLKRIEKGQTRVVLDFDVPAGAGMALGTNDEASVKVFGSKSPLLYRTEGDIPYPLVSGPVSIYGTNSGAANYYYFYDWEIAYPDLECKSARLPVQAVVNTVGIKNELQGLVSVYPNPTSQSINIDVSALPLHAPFKLELINSVGQVIYNQVKDISNKVIQLEQPDIQPGIYFLRLEQGGRTGILKLIVVN